ncbi:MAG: hypothetical protein WCF65_08195 [Parachlamydiaceae bacterium]
MQINSNPAFSAEKSNFFTFLNESAKTGKSRTFYVEQNTLKCTQSLAGNVHLICRKIFDRILCFFSIRKESIAPVTNKRVVELAFMAKLASGRNYVQTKDEVYAVCQAAKRVVGLRLTDKSSVSAHKELRSEIGKIAKKAFGQRPCTANDLKNIGQQFTQNHFVAPFPKVVNQLADSFNRLIDDEVPEEDQSGSDMGAGHEAEEEGNIPPPPLPIPVVNEAPAVIEADPIAPIPEEVPSVIEADPIALIPEDVAPVHATINAPWILSGWTTGKVALGAIGAVVLATSAYYAFMSEPQLSAVTGLAVYAPVSDVCPAEWTTAVGFPLNQDQTPMGQCAALVQSAVRNFGSYPASLLSSFQSSLTQTPSLMEHCAVTVQNVAKNLGTCPASVLSHSQTSLIQSPSLMEQCAAPVQNVIKSFGTCPTGLLSSFQSPLNGSLSMMEQCAATVQNAFEGIGTCPNGLLSSLQSPLNGNLSMMEPFVAPSVFPATNLTADIGQEPFQTQPEAPKEVFSWIHAALGTGVAALGIFFSRKLCSSTSKSRQSNVTSQLDRAVTQTLPQPTPQVPLKEKKPTIVQQTHVTQILIQTQPTISDKEMAATLGKTRQSQNNPTFTKAPLSTPPKPLPKPPVKNSQALAVKYHESSNLRDKPAGRAIPRFKARKLIQNRQATPGAKQSPLEPLNPVLVKPQTPSTFAWSPAPTQSHRQTPSVWGAAPQYHPQPDAAAAPADVLQQEVTNEPPTLSILPSNKISVNRQENPPLQLERTVTHPLDSSNIPSPIPAASRAPQTPSTVAKLNFAQRLNSQNRRSWATNRETDLQINYMYHKTDDTVYNTVVSVGNSSQLILLLESGSFMQSGIL